MSHKNHISAISNFEEYSFQLLEIISGIDGISPHSSAFEFEDWFQLKLKPILAVNNQNYLLAMIIIKNG